MKVLLLSTERGWGGGEEQLRLLARGLTHRGHQVEIACRKGGRFHSRAAHEQLPALPLPGHPRGVRAVWALRRHIARMRPDVIHANDGHAVSLLRCSTFGSDSAARFASRRVIFPIRSAGRYNRAADRVLCVSGAIRDVAQRSGIDEDRLSIVYDGIDLLRIDDGDACRGQSALGVDDGLRLLLVVASLEPCKGHRYLLEAVAKCGGELSGARIFLAGDGSQRTALETQLAELGIADKVELLGFRDDVPDLIHACDLFVLPSLDEGLGTSAIDALVAGKPVVATTSGGLPEVLRNRNCGAQHGWLVPPADADALAAAIVSALSNPDEAGRRATAGQQYARERFSQQAMVEATLAEYNRVIDDKRSGKP